MEPIKLEHENEVFYRDDRGAYFVQKSENLGPMPAISVSAKTIPGAWELAIISCWEHGAHIATHYDKPGDPPSKEATITVRVDDPFKEPRIHRSFPAGFKELESYRLEVVDGIHDGWINPKEGKWTYTYHDRLCNYNPFPNKDALIEGRDRLLSNGINQIEQSLITLEGDITSKAAQAITWYPMADPELKGDRPCLQRLWFRVLEDKDGVYTLNLNSHWRSRDLHKAWLMNVYGITSLQEQFAKQLSERLNRPVRVGSYIDTSDSLHIYGAYFNELQAQFKGRMKDSNMEDRVWRSDEDFIVSDTLEARSKLAADPDHYAKGKK